jgi:hypothetical protein
MFWNPEKLDSKAVFDLVQLLAREAERCKDSPSAMLVTFPYIQLLDPIMRAPASSGAKARQFALVSTRGHEPPRELTILMLSTVHAFKSQ